MRTIVSVAAVLALAIGITGCWPWKGEDEDSVSRRTLGVDDPRIREVKLEELEADMARPRDGLRLVASLDQTDYREDEPIVLDLRLENVTGVRGEAARDVSVYYEPFFTTKEGGRVEWLFKFLVETEKDGKVAYRSPEFEVSGDERGDYYHFVTLPAQSYLGRSFVLRRGSLKPGRYSLVAAYRVSEDYPYVIINPRLTRSQVDLLSRKLAYVRVWTGRIFSNRVRFRIRKKGGFLWW
jgi:hypothetical protein